MIPAVAHFIWFGRKLPWANALSIRSAALRGGFEQVVLHHADDLSRDDIWPALEALPGFRARRIDVQTLIGATGPGAASLLEIYRRLDAPAARANVLRAAILYAEGGVYLDLDTITLKPLTALRHSCGAFCGEERVILPSWPPLRDHPLARARDFTRLAVRELCRRLPKGWRYFRAVERWYPAGANNAVLGAVPRHPLIRRLLDGMIEVPEPQQRVRFALGVHLLQQTLARTQEPDFHLLPPRAFYPLAPVISHHWFQLRPRAPALDDVLDPETFVVHWYASIMAEEILPFINAEYVRRHARRQLFSALALPLLEPDRQREIAAMPLPDAPSLAPHPPSVGGPAADSAVDPAFERWGYLTRDRVLTAAQCALLEQHLTMGRSIEPADWWKGRAMTDRLLFDIASSEPLLALLRPVLGDNIILYGASTVERRHGERHAWHVDIESSAPGGRFATVWIGLRNTSRESGLKLIGGSHRYPQILQEVQHANGYRRGDADDETVLDWARAFDPAAEIALPDVVDGDAIAFDGRLWHGSLNQRAGGARLALLLQYASVDSPVFKTPSKSLEWPFELDRVDRPPVIVVSGGGHGGGNRQVAPPPTSPPQATTLTTIIQPITLPLAEDAKRGWRQHPFFQGLTDVHDAITCHASVLSPGRMPHPPHCHLEEEILIVLDGDAELLIGDSSDVSRAKAHPVGAGTFAYYPAYQHHTLRNVGNHPLTYLMFRWRGAPVAEAQSLETTIIDLQSQHVAGRKGFRTSLLFERPTHWLGKLHAHYSEVEPGGGYQAHRDPYDIAIVLLSGSIETLGTRVDPFGVVYYAANELHGLRGVGMETARYLVFEFHGLRGGPGGRTHIRGNVPYEERKLYARIARPLRQIPWLRRLLPKRIKMLAKAWLR